MRALRQYEALVTRLLSFGKMDHALLHITQTAIDKGYTDATVPFREFLKRNNVHDYDSQLSGLAHLVVVNARALTPTGVISVQLSLQRPPTKGGRMYRLSRFGGVKKTLNLVSGDILLFIADGGIMSLMNLTDMVERLRGADDKPHNSEPCLASNILSLAKGRILNVMSAMPECISGKGSGARTKDIAELSGLILPNNGMALVNVVIEELHTSSNIEMLSTNPRRYRLCL